MFGIVGGLGPRATVEFYSAFMDAITSKVAGRLPRLLMYSVAMSPQLENTFLQGKVDDNAPERLQVRSLLNEAVEHFVDNQVTTVAMPCNTLQDELTTLCKARGLAIINMINETANAILQNYAKRVLILGTASTYGDDLYGQRLALHGVECIYPTAKQQDFIETYIRFALDQKLNQVAKDRFAENIRQMAGEADGVVLACTDLTGDLSTEACGLPVFDSLQLLATASAAHVLARNELFI